jgi:hypothetical protein
MFHRFGGFGGIYDEFVRLPGIAPRATGGTIRLVYCGGTKFTTEAHDSNGVRFWHGELFMREEAPVLGEGFYSHDARDDTGTHSVLYNPEAKQFNVSGANTSQLEGVKDFKMIWKHQAANK